MKYQCCCDERVLFMLVGFAVSRRARVVDVE